LFDVVEQKIKERSKMIFDPKLVATHAKYKESLDTIVGTLLEIAFLLSAAKFEEFKKVTASIIECIDNILDHVVEGYKDLQNKSINMIDKPSL
jgi:hypothetical protein